MVPFSKPSEKMATGTTLTKALATGEEQLEGFPSMTESTRAPAAPAVNVTWFVPLPAVMVPFVIDHV